MSWFTESNRWKHFIGGFILGLLSLGNWYTALLVGLTASSTLELKDKLRGGKWDWIDWIVTVFGCCLGYSLSLIIKVFLV
jgi:hypothetical protein